MEATQASNVGNAASVAKKTGTGEEYEEQGNGGFGSNLRKEIELNQASSRESVGQ